MWCAAEEMRSDRDTALVDWEARNVPANLHAYIRLETIEAGAGSSPRSSLGAGGETGA